MYSRHANQQLIKEVAGSSTHEICIHDCAQCTCLEMCMHDAHDGVVHTTKPTSLNAHYGMSKHQFYTLCLEISLPELGYRSFLIVIWIFPLFCFIVFYSLLFYFMWILFVFIVSLAC